MGKAGESEGAFCIGSNADHPGRRTTVGQASSGSTALGPFGVWGLHQLGDDRGGAGVVIFFPQPGGAER